MTGWLRTYCLSLPHTTEHVLWGDHLVFKVGSKTIGAKKIVGKKTGGKETGGKMFAVAALGPDGHRMSFKCTPDEFAELIERPGIVPAPYSARMHWVALETEDALPRTEIKRLVRLSYELVVARFPKKVQAELAEPRKNIKAADKRR